MYASNKNEGGLDTIILPFSLTLIQCALYFSSLSKVEKLLDLIRKEYRVTRFKTNSLKLVVLLYGSNNCLENNIKEIIFNNIPKRVKLCS